ncbi:8-amino-7-oxononanoate synthase [Thiofilum flexile]|uniref:8-amino-7-oxononanoate synthase n=1 Tax=Thiofilum flexile TaxID=125627 RepID=UPI0003689651
MLILFDHPVMKDLRARIQVSQAQHLYRQPRISDSPQQPVMTIDGKTILNFCSNDYLGLANHPQVIHAFQQAANQYGVGSGAAHLINGHSRLHQQLEEALASFTGRERALLFSTGYMANLAVANALMDKDDIIFQDRLNHASLIDGALMSNAKLMRYAHNDSEHLRQRMQSNSSPDAMIMTDGVFSMDGDVAPLATLAQIAQQHQAWLMVDDAHGLGVLGKTGGGLVEALQLTPTDVPILMGTLGKAFGTAGAFVAGSHDLIEYLIQVARPFIYTTAQPPAIAGATLASLELVQSEHWRREHLQQLIHYFRQGATQLGLQLMDSNTPIQPIVVGESAKALQISRRLQALGLLVVAIRPPTVPNNTARLRVTFSAAHTREQVDQLLSGLSLACGE